MRCDPQYTLPQRHSIPVRPTFFLHSAHLVLSTNATDGIVDDPAADDEDEFNKRTFLFESTSLSTVDEGLDRTLGDLAGEIWLAADAAADAEMDEEDPRTLTLIVTSCSETALCGPPVLEVFNNVDSLKHFEHIPPVDARPKKPHPLAQGTDSLD
jgi:hypothetical protein